MLCCLETVQRFLHCYCSVLTLLCPFRWIHHSYLSLKARKLVTSANSFNCIGFTTDTLKYRDSRTSTRRSVTTRYALSQSVLTTANDCLYNCHTNSCHRHALSVNARFNWGKTITNLRYFITLHTVLNMRISTISATELMSTMVYGRLWGTNYCIYETSIVSDSMWLIFSGLELNNKYIRARR